MRRNRNVILSMAIVIFILIIFIEIFPILLRQIKGWGRYEQRNEEYTYSIITLSKMAEGEYSGKEIALEDSRGFPEDYSQERETLIFINENDEIVEKKLETGVEEILNISGLQELVDNMTEEKLNASGLEESTMLKYYTRISYIRYADNGYDLSFRVGDNLYLWIREDNRLEKIVDNCREYEWMRNGDLLFVQYNFDEKHFDNLMLWNKENGEIRYIEKNIESFTLCEEENIVYGVQYWAEVHPFGFNTRYRLISKNWETGEYQVIIDEYKGETNRIFYGEDRELFYVYTVKNKGEKIICLDLQSREEKDIYHTDSRIVEIFIR